MDKQIIYAITDYMDKNKNAGLANSLSMAVKQFSRLMEEAAIKGDRRRVEALARELASYAAKDQRDEEQPISETHHPKAASKHRD